MCESKVLTTGIGGGIWDLLNPLINMGVTPNLERLKRKGAPGNMQSVISPSSGPASDEAPDIVFHPQDGTKILEESCWESGGKSRCQSDPGKYCGSNLSIACSRLMEIA